MNAGNADRSRLRQSLDDRLARQGRDDSTDIARLRRGVVSERVLARLSQNDPARWILKGWHGPGDPDDVETIREVLADALIGDSDRDGFEFVLDSSRPRPSDEAGRAGARLHPQLRERRKQPRQDLIDLMILIDDDMHPSAELVAAVDHVFAVRRTHPVPAEIPDAPINWSGPYALLAADLGLSQTSTTHAVSDLRAFWSQTRFSTRQGPSQHG
jgi:hypothetical protein